MTHRTLTISQSADWRAGLRQAGKLAAQGRYAGEVLNFESPAQLFKQLSDKRWELVRLAQGFCMHTSLGCSKPPGHATGFAPSPFGAEGCGSSSACAELDSLKSGSVSLPAPRRGWGPGAPASCRHPDRPSADGPHPHPPPEGEGVKTGAQSAPFAIKKEVCIHKGPRERGHVDQRTCPPGGP